MVPLSLRVTTQDGETIGLPCWHIEFQVTVSHVGMLGSEWTPRDEGQSGAFLGYSRAGVTATEMSSLSFSLSLFW